MSLRDHKAEVAEAGGVRTLNREVVMSFFEKMTFEHILETRRVVTWGHMFQIEGMVCAKALRQEPIWCVGGTPKQMWLKPSYQERWGWKLRRQRWAGSWRTCGHHKKFDFYYW